MLASKNCACRPYAVLGAAAAVVILTGTPVFAQAGSLTPQPEDDQVQPVPVDYVFPDLRPDATTWNNSIFTVRVGFAILGDYTFLDQDSSSIAQVGSQGSAADLRAGRLMFSGQIKFARPWSYLIAADYNEFREPEDKLFEGLDFAVTIPLWRKARVAIGKQKEPFVYEMVGDAANLPQQERILSPFFQSRNIGIRYLDNFLNDRMSISVGIYNDWFANDLSFDESGTQVTGRLTGLALESQDGREYLHLGVGLRYLGADKGQLRYKGRPESNVTDNYVDTGNFPANSAMHLSLEALYNSGPFSVLAEYSQAWVDSPERDDPTFTGYYVTASYVLTGENRPYDKIVGYARRIIPKSRWGAVELVGRFGYLDIDDTQVKGGTLAKWYAGVNWWASRQWKIGMGYGFSDLDRFDTAGQTQSLLTRVQWIY